jgi:septum formation protein
MIKSLILASKSAARRTLLANAGLEFSVVDPCINERTIESDHTHPKRIALELAAAKASAVSVIHPQALVIGADQTLALGQTRLNKPKDMAEARRQLDALNGRTHTLFSAVALIHNGKTIWHTCARASLTMRQFSSQERDHVLEMEGDAVLGSVGAYRLEGQSVRLFKTISGSYFTILGLPLLPLLSALRRHAPMLLDQPAKAEG